MCKVLEEGRCAKIREQEQQKHKRQEKWLLCFPATAVDQTWWSVPSLWLCYSSKTKKRANAFFPDAMGQSSKAQLPWLLWSKHQNSCLQETEIPSFSFCFTCLQFIFHALSVHHCAQNTQVVYNGWLGGLELGKPGFQHSLLYRGPQFVHHLRPNFQNCFVNKLEHKINNPEPIFYCYCQLLLFWAKQT